ncbi:MAG: hypothetical protein CRN43_06890 [Candidatus Nephrothrix sp. EaCA]|nr:MAG: hypothetical protein CRN43_06890 [Candidatus Nephrothrix sp. EaCA]
MTVNLKPQAISFFAILHTPQTPSEFLTKTKPCERGFSFLNPCRRQEAKGIKSPSAVTPSFYSK